jgi:hypothetical protein
VAENVSGSARDDADRTNTTMTTAIKRDFTIACPQNTRYYQPANRSLGGFALTILDHPTSVKYLQAKFP